MNTTDYKGFLNIFISTSLFVLLFVVGMVLFKFGIFIINILINAIKKEHLPSTQKIKGLIDDFDHIACDNILISQNFINAYNENDISPLLKEFYFYEIIYYTNVSLSIIQKLIVNKNLCINDKDNTNRVHLFRLKNTLSMINEIYDFLHTNKENINVDNVLQPSVNDMISELWTTLDRLTNDCDAIKAERYPIN